MNLKKIVKRSVLVLSIIMLCLLTAPALPVSADTTWPEEFYGDIIINGRAASAGTVIVAKIGGAGRGSFTTTEVGHYGGSGTFDSRLVVAGEETEVGEAITFWINGTQANQTAVYEPGQSRNLDLSVEIFPLDASDTQITDALDYLEGAQQSNGCIAAFATSGWAVMAIAAAGEGPDSWTNGGDSVVDYLRDNMNHLDADKATDWERFILAVVAAGENPRDFGGVDCIATLLDFYDGTQIGDDDMLNDDFWGILALTSIGETQGVADSKDFIISHQNSDGGWGWTVGGVSDADNTAAAISALIAAGQSSSSSVITDALDYLKSQQQNDGGFTSEGATNVGVDTWAINAIADAGQSPVAEEWRKSGNNPIGHLLSLQDTDGAFKWSATQRSNPEWMSAYAIIALLGGSWPEDTTAPAISSLSPSSGASTTSTGPTISAGYSDATSGIDTGTAGLTLDGTDVTADATVASSGTSYASSGLSTGTHSVTVTVSDKKGNEASRSWSFSVTKSGGGGPSGGGAAAGVTPVLGYVTSSGKFTEDVTAKSEDDKVELYIPEDTIGKNKYGALLSSISIKEGENPPDPPERSNVVGLVYDFGPDGATFDPPISLTVKYSESKIPEDVAEENLIVAYWDEDADEWVELEGTVDPEDNTITAEVSHFTEFTILAYTRPASFTVAGLSINPTEVGIGETVVVSATVTNTGDLAGTHEVILKVNGGEVGVKEIEVIGGDSEKLSFIVIPDAVGTYIVDVNGLIGSFAVVEKALSATAPPPATPSPPTKSALSQPSPQPEAPETEKSPPKPPAPLPPPPSGGPGNWLLIGGIIAGAILVGLFVFFLIRRFTYY